MNNCVSIGTIILILLCAGCGGGTENSGDKTTRGAKEMPLRVMLIPADGGTEEGTKADFEPVFNAITKAYDLNFTIRVGQAYNAVVEGMVNDQVDIAFFGPITYDQARKRGAAELLAVGETKGKSVYYSGIFCRADSGLRELKSLKGKSVAFGDVNSTSSFNFPVAMLLEAGIDPVKDLSNVYLTGSHSTSLQFLAADKVDAACASFDSYSKAINSGNIDPKKVVPLAKSDPIPYPPLAMHVKLPAALKDKLKEAFAAVHKQSGVKPDMIRGYGGKKVDRYNTAYPASKFDKAMAKLAKVTDELKAEMLKKAGK